MLAAVMLAGILLFPAACGKKEDAADPQPAKTAQKLICGVTLNEPMNYTDQNGKWTGFDTDFAQLVGDKLGMEVVFQEIDWAQKYNELESGAITCIWNGFIAEAFEPDGTPRAQLVDFSYSYMLNQQCVVVKADRAGEFTSTADANGKAAAAEKGSAGETAALDIVGENGTVLDVPAQINAFAEVKSGAVDCAVVDILLARRVAGNGDFSDLAIADVALESELYAVGFKKGDTLRDSVNNAIKELYDAGTLMELAGRYGLENSLILDTMFGLSTKQ